jgi:hypothetical protein
MERIIAKVITIAKIFFIVEFLQIKFFVAVTRTGRVPLERGYGGIIIHHNYEQSLTELLIIMRRTARGGPFFLKTTSPCCSLYHDFPILSTENRKKSRKIHPDFT